MRPIDITSIPDEILAQFSQCPGECIEQLMNHTSEPHDLSVSHIEYEFRKIILTRIIIGRLAREINSLQYSCSCMSTQANYAFC